MSNRLRFLLLGSALGTGLLAGCAEQSPIAADPEAVHGSASITPDAEHAALAELTRMVALALQNPGLRQQVKNDLRRSTVDEHKLHFASYLRGESGGLLLNQMARESGRRPAEVLELVAAVRPLEFYMPALEHRTSWRGEGDLIVASMIEDEEVPVAYTPRGTRVSLDPEKGTPTPVLSLVPVESRFAGATASGTPDCAECTVEDARAGRSATPSASLASAALSYPAGIYFDEMRIHNDHEPYWTKGRPEIEVHIIGQKRGILTEFTTPPTAFNCPSGIPCRYFDENTVAMNDRYTWVFYEPNRFLSRAFDCAGASASGYKDFNFEGEGHFYQVVLFAQQSHFTVSELLLVGGGPLARRNIPHEPPFEIRVIERDDGKECPSPLREAELKFHVEINRITGSVNDYQAVGGFGIDDLRWLWGGNNDMVATWMITSYDALERANGTWLYRSNALSLYNRDADLRITNRGFSRGALPPYEEFHM